MSRLIDADKLKEAIEEEKDDNDYMCRLCLESIKEIIDEQPTAFDVDEVLRQIKDVKDKEYVACTDQKCVYCKYFSTCSCGDNADKLALDCAIEIIKGCGVV